jgi:hypothetical protein
LVKLQNEGQAGSKVQKKFKTQRVKFQMNTHQPKKQVGVQKQRDQVAGSLPSGFMASHEFKEVTE